MNATIGAAAPRADAHGAQIREAIKSRRTVHDFEPEPVDEALLLAALDLARWAPNHHRTEPWRVYLLGAEAQSRITELNALKVAAKRGDKAAAVKRRRWLAMPGWFVMTSLLSEDTLRQQEDYAACCCVVQNLMLALWADGVGVKWTTGDVVRDPAFAEVVGFSAEEEQVVGLFWYGWPATIGQQHRQPVDSFVSRIP